MKKAMATFATKASINIIGHLRFGVNTIFNLLVRLWDSRRLYKK